MVSLFSLKLLCVTTVFLWVQTSSQVANYRPTATPHLLQSAIPTGSNPTRFPTKQPTLKPTPYSTGPGPTRVPSYNPTATPTFEPTPYSTGPGPTRVPSYKPTATPTFEPTSYSTGPGPTRVPSYKPTSTPTFEPTPYSTGPGPTIVPTNQPTTEPTFKPTYRSTGPGPTRFPTTLQSIQPTYASPTPAPTGPTPRPSPQPTNTPTRQATPRNTPRGPTPAQTGPPTAYYPVGVQYNKKKAKAAIAYHSCVQCYSETYAKVTTTDDVENLCKGDWLFVAATGPFFLGAFGLRSEILLPSDGHESNKVMWFHQPGHAIGFNVTYGGIYWPLNGLPGSRVGEFDNVESSTYRKHIYSCPV